MTLSELAILAAYFFVLSILAFYGWHRYVLVYWYKRYAEHVPGPRPQLDPLPIVTIQLPIFNEMYVVDRLIDAVCRMDYPPELMEIQVLDDSTDETVDVAALAVRRWQLQGFNISYLHRTDRTGFKAGALEAGMKVADGRYIAIFDADFVPPVDFLRRALPQFGDPQVGMVQARWGHINADYSTLTKIQSIMLDGHFVLEHGSRNRAGCFFNFNGTAGIWRRDAIETAGGWQHDTLTEDLDLSYRAQLKGWRFVFMEDVIAPAELPVEMNSFKSQQFRWAKGSAQTALKLLPQILSADLPFRVKAEAFFHLTANFNYLLMVVLCVLMFPSMYVRYNMGWSEMLLIDIPLFFAATFSVVNFYAFSQMQAYPNDWKSRLKYLPLLMAVGHRAVDQQHPRRAGSHLRQAERVRAHPQARCRTHRRRLGRQEVPPDDALAAARGSRARSLLHRHGLLRPRQRHLRHAAVPRPVPGRLPLPGADVAVPAVRRRRRAAQHADRRGIGPQSKYLRAKRANRARRHHRSSKAQDFTAVSPKGLCPVGFASAVFDPWNLGCLLPSVFGSVVLPCSPFLPF